jgi:tetratricopeptide (TPR) repeat protein
MLPRAEMVATRNPDGKFSALLAGALLILLSGCTPAGPRALVQGDELLRLGKLAEAIAKLERARDLMPDEPRAWNLLGLAYHRAGQPERAVQAYRQALAKDRSNIVAVAHYNLGCLLLEQNNAAAAADELRSFTLTTNSALGLVKLGTVQLHLRQLNEAERSFGAALRLDPKNCEALNGTGIVHAQRNQRDAAHYFNVALQSNPRYAPALLNLAILAQQSPATKVAALQQYRDYLALQPKSPQAEPVKLLIRQLETELAPARPAPPSNNVAQLPPRPKTNIAALPLTNTVVSTSAPGPVRVAAPAPATNSKPQTASIKTNPPVVITRTNEPVAFTNPPLITPSLPVTVVTVTNEPPPTIAAASPIATGPATPAPEAVLPPAEPPPAVATPAIEEEKRPGLLTRLNPFRNKPTESDGATRTASASTNPAISAAGKPAFPRYSYTFPRLPGAGNRAEAERAIQQAMKLAHAGRTNEALADVQVALAADPGYFDAQYNGALLAMQAGDSKRALAGWEMALAVQPDSLNARYNFALALKQANYPYDAAGELEKIIDGKPNDVRAHLTLANLCAQQLEDVEKARVHYTKVLELDPRNPQAPAIRFWLAANP